MGTLSLIVQKSTAEAIPYSVTIADADIDRIAAAYESILFPQGIKDEGVDMPRAPTSVEIVAAIATSIVNGVMENAQNVERQKAIATASASVAPISVTPV